MKAVVGLGNPGKRYERTRHNLGRMAMRSFLSRFSAVKKTEHDFSIVYQIVGAQHAMSLLIVEPLVYMNLSGISVKEICGKYAVVPADCLIVYDDYAIPFGKLKVKKKGSAGGHQGMQSVIAELQTEEIPRMRLGIGTDYSLAELTDYVLEEFSPEERTQLPGLLRRAADAIECFAQQDIEMVMNRFNA